MKDVLAITKALADENRTRVLMFLRAGELCVCQIMEMLGLAPSTVSKHLNILHHAGLLESRKEGRWIYYWLPGRDAPPRIRGVLRWLQESLADDPQIAQDAKKLKCVLKMTRQELCRHYKSC
jgi:DNA-binding transcriptional ArsR family regulator